MFGCLSSNALHVFVSVAVAVFPVFFSSLVVVSILVLSFSLTLFLATKLSLVSCFDGQCV